MSASMNGRILRIEQEPPARGAVYFHGHKAFNDACDRALARRGVPKQGRNVFGKGFVFGKGAKKL